MPSRPSACPNCDLWIISSTRGFIPTSQSRDATLTLSLLTLSQHLEGRILEIGNTSEVQGDDLGLRFRNQESYFLGDVFSISEKHPALQPQQQQAGKCLIFGMFLGAGPEYIRARLASQNVHRRISHLVGKRYQRNNDGNDDSLQCSYQHHARECDEGPGEFRSYERRESSRNSIGLISPME